MKHVLEMHFFFILKELVNMETTFDVHGFVHRRYISKYNQKDAKLHNLFISVK
jgi:hypothetical protein